MANESEILSEADEFEALLPWYISGKINAADKATVERYLEKNPAARSHVEMVREEADEIFAQNAAIEPPRAALDKLRASVTTSPSARLHAAKTSFVDKLGLFLAGLSPRQLAYSGITAALAIAVLAGSVATRPASQDYVTASDGETISANGTYALVAFQQNAPAGSLLAFLTENKLTIVEGPKAGGVFRVRLSENVMTKDALDAALAKLKAKSDIVSFASAAPAQ